MLFFKYFVPFQVFWCRIGFAFKHCRNKLEAHFLTWAKMSTGSFFDLRIQHCHLWMRGTVFFCCAGGDPFVGQEYIFKTILSRSVKYIFYFVITEKNI